MPQTPLTAQSSPDPLAVDTEEEFQLMESRAQQVLDQAAALGADQTEIMASSQRGLSVNVRMGEVETIEHTRDRGLTVTLYRGRRKGSASCGSLDPGAVKEIVTQADQIARFTEEDRCNGLADADLMATEFPDLSLWHPASVDVTSAGEQALACEQAARDVDSRITNSEGASVSASAGLSLQANSHGFLGRRSATRFSRACAVIAQEDSGMQRDYWFDSDRRLQALDSAESIGREAARRALARLGSRSVPTTRVPVLFAPEIARGLLGHLVAAVSGSNLYRQASFLLDSVGQPVFPDWVNITEHPHLLAGPSSTSFDADGVATRELPLVAEGVLQRYVLGSYSARRLGLETTANAGGVHNLRLTPNAGSQQDIVGGISQGLLVTEVMGQGVNIVTGDFSRGAAGFWIEDGEIAFPVEEITIAGNLRGMFAGLEAAGADVDTRRGLQTGSLLINEMTVAGN